VIILTTKATRVDLSQCLVQCLVFHKTKIIILSLQGVIKHDKAMLLNAILNAACQSAKKIIGNAFCDSSLMYLYAHYIKISTIGDCSLSRCFRL